MRGTIIRIIKQIQKGVIDDHIVMDPLEGGRGAPHIDYSALFWEAMDEWEYASGYELAPTDGECGDCRTHEYLERALRYLQRTDVYHREIDVHGFEIALEHFVASVRRYHAFKMDVLRDMSDYRDRQDAAATRHTAEMALPESDRRHKRAKI